MPAASDIVLVSVRPKLLGSVLGRLLAHQGWHICEHRAPPGTSLAAVVVSGDEIIDLRALDAGLVVVLPDEHGVGGRILRAGCVRGEPFPVDGELLGAVLDTVGVPP